MEEGRGLGIHSMCSRTLAESGGCPPSVALTCKEARIQVEALPVELEPRSKKTQVARPRDRVSCDGLSLSFIR